MPTLRTVIPLLLVSMSALQADSASDASAMVRVCQRFSPFDLNGDGVAEIRWVRMLGNVRQATGPRRGLLLIIVEPRLLPGLTPLTDPPVTALTSALDTFAADLAAEGWAVAQLAMQVYDGPVHQDGRSLLAMREVLRAVRATIPDFTGVVIIGSFPEAMLVRQYNWRQRQPTSLAYPDGTKEDFGGAEVSRLRSRAEMVAGRCELVLADLDGNWERLYHAGPEDLQHILAVYPDAVPPEGQSPESEWLKGGSTQFYEMGYDRYTDFFFVNDGRYALEQLAEGGIKLTTLDDLRDEECSAEDKQRGNPMARPDILVSRINARHIALKPKSSVRGVSGEGLLDDRGLPQTVTFASEAATPRGLSVWGPDPELEQRLLVEYFDRNHRYRHGAFRDHLKPAAAAYGLGSFMGELRGARPEWQDFNEPSFDLTDDTATLDAVVEWLKRPAILRALAAHSDPWGCHFKEQPDVAVLEAACGGQPWSWIKQGNKLVPTLGITGKLDFAITRTLWQNGVLPDTANFFLHSGCEAIMPGGAMSHSYTSPDYAYWQGAEGLLFYCKGLALVGRAKVFYDFPTDFAKELGAGKTFGEAWAHYFEVESAEPVIENVGGGIGRKRAYFWSVLGDWTLRLR